jgi:hypothetical protein
MVGLQWLIFFVSLTLQVLVIAQLRRGAYREYPFIFIYSLALIMTSVADAAVFADLATIPAMVYYRNEALRQFLLFTVVVSLMDRTMRNRPHRARVRALLTLFALVVVLVSMYVHRDAYGSHFSVWATQVSRDVSFGSVILTLLLWVTLVSSRRRDVQLLMLTGGLGLQFTGEAISQSIRQLAIHNHYRLVESAGGVAFVASHLIRLYVWREALRKTGIPEHIKNEPDEDTTHLPRQAHQLLAEEITA